MKNKYIEVTLELELWFNNQLRLVLMYGTWNGQSEVLLEEN